MKKRAGEAGDSSSGRLNVTSRPVTCPTPVVSMEPAFPARRTAATATVVLMLLALPLSPLFFFHVPPNRSPFSVDWGAEAATEGFESNVRVDDTGGGTSEQSYCDMAFFPPSNVYVVWMDDRNGDYDIYFSKSTDGGKTYGANVRVDDAPSGKSSRYPSVAVTVVRTYGPPARRTAGRASAPRCESTTIPPTARATPRWRWRRTAGSTSSGRTCETATRTSTAPFPQTTGPRSRPT
jgi:hypothetical protein